MYVLFFESIKQVTNIIMNDGIYKRDHNSCKYFMLLLKQISRIHVFVVIYIGIHFQSTYPIL